MKKIFFLIVGIISLFIITSCQVTVTPVGNNFSGYYYQTSPYYQKSSGYYQGYHKVRNDFYRGYWNYNVRYRICY